jgi:hypothetical protein
MAKKVGTLQELNEAFNQTQFYTQVTPYGWIDIYSQNEKDSCGNDKKIAEYFPLGNIYFPKDNYVKPIEGYFVPNIVGVELQKICNEIGIEFNND